MELLYGSHSRLVILMVLVNFEEILDTMVGFVDFFPLFSSGQYNFATSKDQ